MNRLTEAVLAFQRFSDRKWYLPLMGGLAAADLFIAVVPTDALLVGTVMLKPKRWIRMALFFTTASALGAIALSESARLLGDGALHEWVIGLGHSNTWVQTEAFLLKNGKIALFLAALGPVPLAPAVAVGGMSHMPVWEVFLSVWLGRGVKYVLFAYLATHMPHALRRLGFKSEEVGDVVATPPTDSK